MLEHVFDMNIHARPRRLEERFCITKREKGKCKVGVERMRESKCDSEKVNVRKKWKERESKRKSS
jgi:hypothetical protein